MAPVSPFPLRRPSGGPARAAWAVGVVAPWCLGAGLLVSATADAGQDVLEGTTRSPLATRAAAIPDDLVPRVTTGGALAGSVGTGRGLLREARLTIGTTDALRALPDEIDPRRTLKPNSRDVPLVDRARRGDPLVSLRPGFDAKLRGPGGYARFIASDLAFRIDESSPMSSFAPSEGETDGPDSVSSFEPWADGEAPTTTGPVEAAAGSATPGSATPSGGVSGGVSVVTMRPAALSVRLAQGATPAVPRAVALGSATPAPADARPLEVLATTGRGYQGRRPDTTARAPDRPSFAAFGTDARERKCLAEAVYFEARSEPEQGQAAVAQVVLNRVTSGLYPASICGVVYQNRARYKACQFSFACEGKSLRVADESSWAAAVRIADSVLDGRTYVTDVGRATHYHANYVRPAWSRYLKRMDTIGRHIFYSLRTRQG